MVISKAYGLKLVVLRYDNVVNNSKFNGRPKLKWINVFVDLPVPNE